MKGTIREIQVLWRRSPLSSKDIVTELTEAVDLSLC